MAAAVFDLDGTLLNTLGDIAGAANHVLASLGRPAHSIPAYARMVGNGFDALMTAAIGEPRPEPGKMREIIAQARERYAGHMMDETRPYPGMTQALDQLARAGLRLAVLSNKPDELSGVLIARYFPDVPFERVVGARPGVPLKPDPSALLELLQSIGSRPEDAFYIGDSDVDMLTARAAGCMAIGCAWGFRGAEELAAAGADRILNEPSGLAMLPAMLRDEKKTEIKCP